MFSVISQNLGWTCPKCGRCYAPLQLQCFECNKDVVQKTTLTTNAPVCLSHSFYHGFCKSCGVPNLEGA
jgi:hypothetical protein